MTSRRTVRIDQAFFDDPDRQLVISAMLPLPVTVVKLRPRNIRLCITSSRNISASAAKLSAVADW